MKILILVLAGLLSSHLFAQQDRGSGGGKGGNGTFRLDFVLMDNYVFKPDHCTVITFGADRWVCDKLESNPFNTFDQQLFSIHCCRKSY